MKQLVREIRPHVRLYSDPKSGIAWVENGEVGLGHSSHPNIAASGSVRGMKQLGYWEKDAKTVRSHGFIYNVDRVVVSDELDDLARQHCHCGGQH